jgi:hypothetical protein
MRLPSGDHCQFAMPVACRVSWVALGMSAAIVAAIGIV